MANVVDRRTETGKKYTSSRKRFMERNRRQIRKAIDKKIADTNIKDIGKDGVDATVPREGIREPFIHHGQGGKNQRVMPGNKDFNTGDKIPRPPGGGGGQGNGPGEPGEPSDSGEGEDEFTFTLSEEEFMDMLFEDMALPNLTKQSAQDTKTTKPKRSGFVTDGPINKIDLPRSKTGQLARHFAFNKPHDRKILEALKEKRAIYLEYDPDHNDGDEVKHDNKLKQANLAKKIKAVKEEVEALEGKFGQVLSQDHKDKIEELDQEIATREKKKKAIPKWNKDTDMKYRHHVQQPTPTTQAAMICLMDVSASMDEHKKANAKLFYMLLHQFLLRNYEKVDVVFVRHTTEAEEVDEETFFYDRQTGGTRVSSALEKMQEIIKERYPPNIWNIYGAQASDGENWGGDNEICLNLLSQLMPEIQAYFYTEVVHPNGYRFGEMLWEAYEEFAQQHPEQFFMGKIEDKKDIFPVFRDFFQKRENFDITPSSLAASSYQPSMP